MKLKRLVVLITLLTNCLTALADELSEISQRAMTEVTPKNAITVSSKKDRKSIEELSRIIKDISGPAGYKQRSRFLNYFDNKNLVLFFERRQLVGPNRIVEYFETVKKIYLKKLKEQGRKDNEQLFKHYIHEVYAKGSFGYVASNFQYQQTDGSDKSSFGRATWVFEKKNGKWKIIHAHVSFQGPTGPQRAAPLKTDSGRAWDPVLEGTWELTHFKGSKAIDLKVYLIASRFQLLINDLKVSPTKSMAPSSYVLSDKTLNIAGKTYSVEKLNYSLMTLKLPTGITTWKRVSAP